MKKSFRLTALAGSHFAGKRIRDPEILAGTKPLQLTDAEAEHELRQGTIEPFPGPAPAPKGKKAD